MEKILKRLRGYSGDTVCVKMGVAEFAPCLLVVVDGCFSLPADAARWLKQLPKRFLVEKNEYKKRNLRSAPECTWQSSWDVEKRRKKLQRDRKYRRDRKKEGGDAGLASVDWRGTSVKPGGITTKTSGCCFQSKTTCSWPRHWENNWSWSPVRLSTAPVYRMG